MNTETSKVMFALLRSAVCGGLLSGEEISLYSPDILPEIMSLAQKHDVIHLIVFALKKNGLLDEGKRTESDGQGKPYPLLYMKLKKNK